jgi:hypothetical protein
MNVPRRGGCTRTYLGFLLSVVDVPCERREFHDKHHLRRGEVERLVFTPKDDAHDVAGVEVRAVCRGVRRDTKRTWRSNAPCLTCAHNFEYAIVRKQTMRAPEYHPGHAAALDGLRDEVRDEHVREQVKEAAIELENEDSVKKGDTNVKDVLERRAGHADEDTSERVGYEQAGNELDGTRQWAGRGMAAVRVY